LGTTDASFSILGTIRRRFVMRVFRITTIILVIALIMMMAAVAVGYLR
jgi:hypothetical protein